MQHYANKISPPMEIKASGDNILYGTVQGIILVLVRDIDNVCRRVKLSIVVVPGSKKNPFSSAATAQKDMKTGINKRADHTPILVCFLSS